MALPAFASSADLALRMPGGLPTEDEPRADAALSDASALIRAEAGKTWSADGTTLDAELPDVIVAVTIAAARRAMTNPDGVASESIQDYSRTFGASTVSTDIYLTRGERQAVRRAAGRSGLWTLATTRVDVGSDVPALVSPYVLQPTAVEEYDPYSEGWPG